MAVRSSKAIADRGKVYTCRKVKVWTGSVSLVLREVLEWTETCMGAEDLTSRVRDLIHDTLHLNPSTTVTGATRSGVKSFQALAVAPHVSVLASVVPDKAVHHAKND